MRETFAVVLSAIWEITRSIGLPVVLLILGAGVARTWQQRNWLVQQRIADKEKLNLETKKLFDDFVDLSSKRHFRSRRLYWALQQNNLSKIEAERLKYDEIVYQWNDAEISWKVRFVKNLDNGLALSKEIDEQVRLPFVDIGHFLELGLRRCTKPNEGVAELGYLSADELFKISNKLDGIARSIFEIGRAIYGKINFVASHRLDATRILRDQLDSGSYDELGLYQLFKATLTSKIDPRA